jgi:hypothetical protein
MKPRRFASVRPYRFFTAAVYLVRARLMIARLGSPRILAELLTPAGPKLRAPTGLEIQWLQEMAWALQAAAPRLPFRTDCLVRVVAGHMILRRAGLKGTVSFQAGKDAGQKFEAHAWLESGGILISGPGRAHLGTFNHPL